jgi:preprotein translocase SecE subunit
MNQIKYFFKEFLPEVRAEWKKVTTPSRREVVQTTVVVVVTSVIFALYLAAADRLIIWAYESLFEVLGL